MGEKLTVTFTVLAVNRLRARVRFSGVAVAVGNRDNRGVTRLPVDLP